MQPASRFNPQPPNNAIPRSSHPSSFSSSSHKPNGRPSGGGGGGVGVSSQHIPIPPALEPSQARGIVREAHGRPPDLPAENVFPIQIGSELFRLSGASLTSDGPSYFTRFFEEQLRADGESGGGGGGTGVRTLYIDRDPTIFRDIALHLRGYYVQPVDGTHYVRLFADAQFYSLPRLISQLFSEPTFIQIGPCHFRVPKDIFSSPGDTPNFFSLGIGASFTSPEVIFPGLDRTGLLRPPPILPPAIPTRSAEVFAQLLHALKGYEVKVKDEEHRKDLLRDCRYFNFRGLEQRLVACNVGWDALRGREEITLRWEDVKVSAVSFVVETTPPDAGADANASHGVVHYTRPFVDETPRELIVEIGGEGMVLDQRTGRSRFTGPAGGRILSLLRTVSDRVNGVANVCRDDEFRFLVDHATAHVVLDGRLLDHAEEEMEQEEEKDAAQKARTMTSTAGQARAQVRNPAPALQLDAEPASKKRKLDSQDDETAAATAAADGCASASARARVEFAGIAWTVRTGQWRIWAQRHQEHRQRWHDDKIVTGGLEIILVAVKVDACTNERARNAQRKFLR